MMWLTKRSVNLLIFFHSINQSVVVAFGTPTFIVSNTIPTGSARSYDETGGRLIYPPNRNYVYLNYKEAYGIRYDPGGNGDENRYSASQMEAPIEPSASSEMETMQPVGGPQMEKPTELDSESAISPMQSSEEPGVPVGSEVPQPNEPMPTVAVATETTTECVTEAVPTAEGNLETAQATNKKPTIAFSALAHKPSNKLKNNSTQMVQPISSIRETLNLIRRRVKQWFTSGIDLNAPIINGQRFLNLFNIIKFENSECTSTQEMLEEMTGTCYHDYQCTDMGGTSIGECADGLGVCCIFKAECGQKTNQMTTYFQNPSWPEASLDRIICTLTVELQPDVTQILLDFVLFELKAPTDGNCVEDQFVVAGQNLNNPLPTICGINSGQHMYIEVDNAMDRKIFLSILTKAAAARAYNIRVTQLIGGSGAPSNCLQYYTEPEGWMQTFNYDDTSQFVDERIPSYFNNMNYAICINKQWDTCSVTYTNEVDAAEYDFQLINVDAGGTSVIPEKMAGVEIFNCNDDFISVNSIRLCGEKLNDASRIDDLTLNAPITDLANGPIVLPVRTNGAIVGRGFRVNYKLNPCQPTMMPPSEATEEIITEELPVQRTRIRIRKKYQ